MVQMQRVAGDCPDGNTCPTLFKTDRGTAVVQGPQVGGDILQIITLPDGEIAVEIPWRLIEEAARASSA